MDEYVEEELKRANEALSDAEILLESGSERAVINRLYYACFHATRAVLYERGFDPRHARRRPDAVRSGSG